MASSDWQQSEAFNRTVQNFHEKRARQPTGEIDRAKQKHTSYMGEVEQQFRKQGLCVRLEYTGSTYEGTKVANDLEFDVMVIVDSRGVKMGVENIPGRPGFAKLKLLTRSASNFFGVVEGDYLNADRTANKFFGELQKCINSSDMLKNSVLLRRHGPAAQMDVMEGGRVFYTVDVVPTYEVDGGRYVAKPTPVDGSMPSPLAWRRSFSVEEKSKLIGADRDNGCRKKILRILKVLKNREAGLASLTSYHLKTALFMEMDSVGGSQWSEGHLGQRLMGVLRQLERCLSAGNLPHPFIGNINLLSSLSQTCINNMRDRVGRLLRSEPEMNRVLSA